MYDFQGGHAPHLRQRGPKGIPARPGAIADKKFGNDGTVLLDLVLHGTDAVAGQSDESEEEPGSCSGLD